MAMSRDDDKIGFAIACDIGDYFKGGAHSDNHFFQELRFNRLLSQCIQFFSRGSIGKPSPIGSRSSPLDTEEAR